MAQRSAKKTYPAPPAAHPMPRQGVGHKDKEALIGDGFNAWAQHATQEILAVTYWFDPTLQPEPYSVTVRFSGYHVDVKKGRSRTGNRFVHDETIENVVPGSGPISVTARIRDINPGTWIVTAQLLSLVHLAHGHITSGDATPAAGLLRSTTRLWRRWAPSAGSAKPVKTRLTPFIRVPGIIPCIWGSMVILGMLVALVFQSLLIFGTHLAVGPWWIVSPGAIVVGIIGAKGWYIYLYRREHLMNGWCIQGFITGATLTAAILLVVLHMPAGVFLDVTAPGLLIAMAIGRVGCFFAGCCGGPPTASRWGVWSSDQRVGARRVPTQLMESGQAGIIGVAVLIAFVNRGPANGAFFVAGLATYTLGRQAILHLRAEPRKTRLGGLVMSVLAAFVLIVALVWSR